MDFINDKFNQIKSSSGTLSSYTTSKNTPIDLEDTQEEEVFKTKIIINCTKFTLLKKNVEFQNLQKKKKKELLNNNFCSRP